MIEIAREFSEYPAGRKLTDGPNSGERFREDFLVAALKHPGKVEILLDGTKGYPSSFLEEAFGGAVRKGYADATELKNRLDFIAKDVTYKRYVEEIWSYIEKASTAADRN